MFQFSFEFWSAQHPDYLPFSFLDRKLFFTGKYAVEPIAPYMLTAEVGGMGAESAFVRHAHILALPVWLIIVSTKNSVRNQNQEDN